MALHLHIFVICWLICGPSFVKIGQMLSLRSEILPQAYCDALATLQMDADPLPFKETEHALENIYGERFSSIFSNIDPKPLGSASLAQVHKATLSNGDVVAVKVQRQGVRCHHGAGHRCYALGC